jgi:hypothetical protein
MEKKEILMKHWNGEKGYVSFVDDMIYVAFLSFSDFFTYIYNSKF